MDLRELRTFRTVATLLSFNRAAQVLHYAQSTVSAQVQALEEDLDVRLFDRLGRAVILTEAGERLLAYAEKLLDVAEEARAEVKGGSEALGTLTIRVPESLCVLRLPPVLARFQARFPRVRLNLTTCTHEGLAKDLRQGVTDLAFLLADTITAADLEVEHLGAERLVLAAPPGHPLAGRRKVRAADLQGATLLLTRVDCSYRRPFEQMLRQENAAPGCLWELGSVEAVKRCVMAGLGLTILPRAAVAGELASGKLMALAWPPGGWEVAILMIWHRQKWLSPTLRAFMEEARQALGTVFA